jgi:hypothetical protein
VTEIDKLPAHQSENLLRIHYAAEARAAALNLPFSMSLAETFEAIEDFGGSLDDPLFLLPAGLVGKW